MKHEIRSIPGRGRVLWLTDGRTELGIALDVGIRILHCSYVGCENLLYEQPDNLNDGLSTKDGWRIYGGHRYWTAPESDLSYYPDNQPVSYELTVDGVILSQNDDPWLKIKKQIEIKFCEDGSIFLLHRAKNISDEIQSFASWGVTTFDKGNACIGFPQGKLGAYTPDRKVSLWGESTLTDERIQFRCDKILASHISLEHPFKMGVFSSNGHADLTNKGQRFTLTFEADAAGQYPDGGCNFEVYMDAHVLEMEALGQVCSLQPGEAAVHWERWQIERI